MGEAYDTSFRSEDTVTVNADCTPPSTSIDAGPQGATPDSTPRFEFSGQGGTAGFECSVDSAPFNSCVSPFLSPPLEDGVHTFEVRAVDAVGNVDTSPARRVFQVDTEPPETTLIARPDPVTRDRAADFSFVSSGGTGFECSMDGGQFESCTAPVRYGRLREGAHAFQVRAIDSAGNRDPSPAQSDFTVDSRVSGADLEATSPQRFNGRLRLRAVAELGERGLVTARARIEAGARIIKPRVATLVLAPRREERFTITAGPRRNTAIKRALRQGEVEATIKARFVDRVGNPRSLRVPVRITAR